LQHLSIDVGKKAVLIALLPQRQELAAISKANAWRVADLSCFVGGKHLIPSEATGACILSKLLLRCRFRLKAIFITFTYKHA
jgi:hypothetical protein